MPSFDTIAKPYKLLEQLSMGNTLQRTRLFCLDHLQQPESGLLVGDGDGRFSSTALGRFPELRLDSVDSSLAMLQLAKARTGENANRLNCIHEDARNHQYPVSKYDFIALHFCLDCFSSSECSALIPKLESSLNAGGLIAYSDFQTTRAWHRPVVRLLYACFRLAAGLKIQTLPKANWSNDLKVVAETRSLGDLVFSRVLQKIS